MNIQDVWEKALKDTRIIRSRAQDLHVLSDTKLPYIFLAKALVNKGDTVVRKGEVVVEKPAIILASHMPQFEGFDFEEDIGYGQDSVTNFLLIRGITFPSMKYNNKTESLSIFDGHIDKVIAHHSELLEKKEDVHSGLIVGSEDCWQFCVLIFICSQIARSSNTDIRRLLDHYRKDKPRT